MKCLKKLALINSLKRIEIYGFQSRTDGRTIVDIFFYYYYYLFVLIARRYKLSSNTSFMKISSELTKI